MRQPEFWYRVDQRICWQSLLLAPLGAIYGALTARRAARMPLLHANIPVICVGNLNVGGTGKTPTTIALAQRLSTAGATPHIVSRGFGGTEKGPLRVDETRHNAADVGDEPLLLAAFAPTWVCEKRADGVRAAETDGADVILLDDGFQNPDVAKNLSLVVVDAKRGFGNGRVLPAGPLRESVVAGLKRADFVISIGDAKAQESFTSTWKAGINCPISTGELVALPTGMDWRGLDVLAFAGIGHPAKFFDNLCALGANLIKTQAFDDHQKFPVALLKRLEIDAQAAGAQLVTTEKDAVRLPREFRSKVLTLPVRLELTDWSAIDAAFDAIGIRGFSSHE